MAGVVEQARISITDLDHLLGYKDKQGLQRLADRHAEQLEELGKTFTVKVKLQAGQGTTRDFAELAFNQPQVMFLVGKSAPPRPTRYSCSTLGGSSGDGTARGASAQATARTTPTLPNQGRRPASAGPSR